MESPEPEKIHMVEMDCLNCGYQWEEKAYWTDFKFFPLNGRCPQCGALGKVTGQN